MIYVRMLCVTNENGLLDCSAIVYDDWDLAARHDPFVQVDAYAWEYVVVCRAHTFLHRIERHDVVRNIPGGE